MKNLIFSFFLLLSLSPIFGQKTFTLSSPNLGGQATSKEFFDGFGCTGDNTSPQLQWKNPPEGVKSYAITMYDKDAPTGSGWWHWLAFDIPASTSRLAANAGDIARELMPKGSIQSRTDLEAMAMEVPAHLKITDFISM